MGEGWRERERRIKPVKHEIENSRRETRRRGGEQDGGGEEGGRKGNYLYSTFHTVIQRVLQ